MVTIELRSVSKSYKKIKAVDNVSLKIKDNEYFILLGPTGAGKTTLLKLIAGLIKPDSGKVYFDGKDVTKLAPDARNIGFMFENYALFPHMSIYDNIAYSSRVHARDKNQTKTIVEQVLMMTLLTGRNKALPKEMSGGMQQRVALCRALMNLEQTKTLILDEPLKALDAGLRMSLRRELLQMAKSAQLQLTVVHVTNEEQEAMMVADKIAVINEGKVMQIGTPYEIYYRPNDLFVANFLSEINCFDGTCLKDQEPTWDIHSKSKRGDKFFAELQQDSYPILVDLGPSKPIATYIRKELYEKFEHGTKVLLVVRANHIKIRLGDRTVEKRNSLFGRIQRRKFMGAFYRFEVLCKLNGTEKLIIISTLATSEIHKNFVENSEVTVYFPKELGILFEHPGEEYIKEVFKLE
ncbi:MAG: ABC transporter ATP-binding protein [Candidatus Lokiarchaeota archaeon]|nr:ABC transporter ATP-binding protein [Candidatus Lokiarchaeota archaeon]